MSLHSQASQRTKQGLWLSAECLAAFAGAPVDGKAMVGALLMAEGLRDLSTVAAALRGLAGG